MTIAAYIRGRVPQSLRGRRGLRGLGGTVLALIVLCVLGLGSIWLAAPSFMKTRAEHWVTERSGHTLKLGHIALNPLQLSATFSDVTLLTPQAEPLLRFDTLLVDFSLASLVHRAPVLDTVRLDGLRLALTKTSEGSNWGMLLAALSTADSTATASPAEPLALDIHQLAINQAVVELADTVRSPIFTIRLDPLDLVLHDVNTQAGHQGDFSVRAVTPLGAQVAWEGRVGLNPMASRGTISFTIDDLARLQPLLPPDLPVIPQGGRVQLTTHYDAALGSSSPRLDFSELALHMADLVMTPAAGQGVARLVIGEAGFDGARFSWPEQKIALPAVSIHKLTLSTGGAPGLTPTLEQIALESIQADGVDVNIAARSARVSGMSLTGARAELVRDANGQITLVELINRFNPPVTTESKTPWRYSIDGVNVADAALSLRHPANKGSTETLHIDNIALQAHGLSDNLEQAVPVKVELRVAKRGTVRMAGKVAPNGKALDATLQITDLTLKPAQAWLTAASALIIKDGRLQANGRIKRDETRTGFNGSARIDALDLVQEGLDQTFIGWKSLTAPAIEVSDRSLDIPELRLDGLNGKLIIYSDQSINLKRILRTPATTETSPSPATGTEVLSPPPFQSRIGRVTLRDGRLDFGDYSLVLPFEVNIHHLDGVIAGLANTPGLPGQVILEGEVDDYGLARAQGDIELFDPTANTRIAVSFRNVEMTRLTPYLATFAGRSIRSGKMALDLNYTVQQRAIQGQNKLVIQSLELGDRVESPSARQLPLDFAIALLEDSDGRIDLEIPVNGSLDEPGFSYGHLVWQAIGNVLGKLATAPFRALGKLFGGSGDAEPVIKFEPGATQLTPPEREKLVTLANGLKQRGGLRLVIQGQWSESDSVALRERRVRRAVRALIDPDVRAEDDRLALQMQSPTVRKGLEELASARLGKKELATLRDAHRQANPEAAEAPVMQRLVSQLTALVDAPRAPSAEEMSAARGRDFHAGLYALLLAHESIDSATLTDLAAARSAYIAEFLTTQQLPVSRWKIEPVTKGAAQTSAETSHGLHLGLESIR